MHRITQKKRLHFHLMLCLKVMLIIVLIYFFTTALLKNNFAEREKTACERHRESAQATASSNSNSGIFSFFRPRPAVGHYVPQCDQYGAYESTQCHASIGQCWCVNAEGQEVPNTRTGPGTVPLCKSPDFSYTHLLLVSLLLHTTLTVSSAPPSKRY